MANVNENASPRQRAATFWALINEVVEDLDNAVSDSIRLNIKTFLLHVAWHEGAKLKERKQIPANHGNNPPGRSFFQFEPARAKDAVAYAKDKGWLSRLATASGESEGRIEEAGNALLAIGGNANSWPVGNLIERYLVESDLFGLYMTRIILRKTPQRIEEGHEKHANYWADHWKRVFNPTPAMTSEAVRQELIQVFIRETAEVDALFP